MNVLSLATTVNSPLRTLRRERNSFGGCGKRWAGESWMTPFDSTTLFRKDSTTESSNISWRGFLFWWGEIEDLADHFWKQVKVLLLFRKSYPNSRKEATISFYFAISYCDKFGRYSIFRKIRQNEVRNKRLTSTRWERHNSMNGGTN